MGYHGLGLNDLLVTEVMEWVTILGCASGLGVPGARVVRVLRGLGARQLSS